MAAKVVKHADYNKVLVGDIVSQAVAEYTDKQVEHEVQSRLENVRKDLRYQDYEEADLQRSIDTPFIESTEYTLDTLVKEQEVPTSKLADYLETYQALCWVFVGVSEIASNLAMVPPCVWLADKSLPHPLLSLLRNPNNLLTQYKLLNWTFAYLELTGNAYWFIIPGNDGLPAKIHLPRPDRVQPRIVNEQGDIQYIRQYGAEGKEEKWDMKYVVHFSYFNPLSQILGMGGLMPAEHTAVVELYEIAYGQNWFKNAMHPSMIFKSAARMDKSERKRLFVNLKRLHQGVERMHKAALIEGDVTPLDISTPNAVESGFGDVKQLNREEILGTFKCYHVIESLKDGGDVQDAWRMFWESLLPKLTNFQQTIDKELMHEFYPAQHEYEFKFDIRGISGLRPGVLEQSLADLRDWQMGVKTPNEIRLERGIPDKVYWGDHPPPVYQSFARSRTEPNETRGFSEAQQPHPERNMTRIPTNDTINKIVSKIKGHNGNLSEEEIRDAITSELQGEYYYGV